MATGSMVHLEVRVFGRVQGVGFRYSALHHAISLGIKGYVRNMRDGSVKLEIEGTEQAVNEMIKWCRLGPPHGHVSDVYTSGSDLIGFTDFTIR
jgi:acylphosphatase